MPQRIVTVANVEGQPMRLLYWLLITTLIMLFALIVLLTLLMSLTLIALPALFALHLTKAIRVQLLRYVATSAPDRGVFDSWFDKYCDYISSRPPQLRCVWDNLHAPTTPSIGLAPFAI